MTRPASPLRRFAGSLLLSGAFHAAALTALAIGALTVTELRPWRLYEIDIEPEPPRVTVPPAPAPEPAAPERAEADGVPGGVPGGVVGGVRVPYPVGPGAVVGERAAPAAAQAGRVLAVDGAGAPVDFTIVQGASGRYAGGVTTATGTSETKVTNLEARGGGVIPKNAAPPGRPAAPPPKAKPRPVPLEKSQAVAARPMTTWSCAFPPEADTSDVNYARVLLSVTVGADGRAEAAVVLSDPGFGFGRAARSCAFSQRYAAARNADGRMATGTTAPFYVTFTR
jgi:protein TonB